MPLLDEQTFQLDRPAC